MEKINYKKKNNSKNKLSSITKNALWALIISLWLSQEPSNAYDLIKPTWTNIIISPIYSFFPWNIYYEDIEKNPKAKKVFEESWKIIQETTNIQDTNEINFEIINLFIDGNNKKISWKDFLFTFFNLGEKYNINKENMLELFATYLRKGFIPKKLQIDIKNKLKISYKWLLNFYEEKELIDKLDEARKLYENWKLDEESLRTIFSEYFNEKGWVDEWADKILMLYSIVLALLIMIWVLLWFEVYKTVHIDLKKK